MYDLLFDQVGNLDGQPGSELKQNLYAKTVVSATEKNEITPKAIAWAIPNLGTFLAQSGLKWSDRQILPPRYILAVFPSSSGRAISGAVTGYVTGI